MDVNEQRVLESLGQLFGVGQDGSRASALLQQQTVFWSDPDAQFSALIPRLSLGAGIEVVDLDQTPALAVKRRLQSHPEIHFLFYSAAAEPAPAQDWLLDVRLRSKAFRADLTSLLIEDLGLTSLSLAPYIRSRAKFLASESRRSKLKRLVEPGDDESALDRKMLAVLLRSDESDGISLALRLLHTLWVPGQPTVGTSSKAWTEVVNNGLDRAFWGLMHLGLGYNSDQPSLDELLRQLLVTDFARSVRRPPPEALRHLVLDNRVVAGNASILVTRWRSDVNLHASFADLSAAVADELRLNALIDHWSAEDLVDCLSFAPAERRIIQDLKGRVVQQGAAALADVQSIAARRRDGHWANTRISPVTDETLALAACYDALEAAAEFLALKERHAAGISFPDAATGADAYIQELHRFDQYYRWFCHAANQVEPTGWGVLQELRAQIEGAYSGWFIPALSSAWTAVLEGPSGLLAHWRLAGLQPQQGFFDRRVANLLASGAAKRVFVLISDAFRYEAAVELTRSINSKNRLTAEIDAMLGVLPSYTALGMASLLPHQSLSYKSGSGLEVLVDGASTASLEARNTQLGRYDGIAVRAPDLLALGKLKGRELIADHRVIYVYHDLIDMIGDKRGSEEKTFEAVADTIKELNQVVSFIINNLNGSLVLVTADHGFLFQESPLDQASKSNLVEKPEGTLRAKKRYLLGRDLPENDKVWQGSTSVSAGTEVKEGSIDYWLPKGAMRFHFVAGARFVHGSAMPQEVIVPVITVRESESDKARTRAVEITLLGMSNKVVTNTQRFELIQTEAVTNRVLPRTVRISIRDGEVHISDEQTVTFDSTSSVLAERMKSVILTLRSGQYDRHKDYHLVARDAQSKIEVLRMPLRIDLAFSNDF